MMKSQNIVSLNPGKNFEIIGEVPISTKEEIDNKVQKAKDAFKKWFALGVAGRNEYLEKLYKEFEKRKNEICILISNEVGMPISICKEYDFEFGLKYMRGYLDNAKTWLSPEIVFENKDEIHYQSFEPIGVAGISIPWNYPFSNFIWSVIQNLIVGNTVVFKHSEECALTGKLLEDILNKILPAGVFNEIYGDGKNIGEYLMNSNIDIIYFTGSTSVGKHLYQVAAKKFIPALLELGGSAPGIVFNDADLDVAIKSIYINRFINCGQTCDGLKRLIVQHSIFDEVVNKLKKLLETKKIGDPQNVDTDLGPLVSKNQLNNLEDQVADAIKRGAQIIYGAKKQENLKGAYYEPTILTNISFDMKVWREEVFGPVLPIVPFKTVEEAIILANDTQYGLGGYIYTKNIDRALDIANVLQSGNININGANYNVPKSPFGGYKNSGLGREHGKLGMINMCNIKIVALQK